MDLEKHNIKTGNTLVIAFGGNALSLGISVFEFQKSLINNFDCSFIFVKDIKRAWYQFGVDGVGSNPEEVAVELKKLIKEIKPSKIVTMGTSAGGYAAILFGALIGVDLVIAFGAQTFLPLGDLRKLDGRFVRFLKTYPKFKTSKYADLKNIDLSLAKKIIIVYGKNGGKDKIHAERIKNFSNVGVIEVSGGHNVVSDMKRKGTFISFLKKNL